MKRILGLMMAVASGVAFAAQNDVVITFSTPGPDTYADGVTKVVDGECYALVWTKAGCAFPGFLADGTVASDDARVVRVSACAAGGRCPPTIFQVGVEEAAALAGGSYGVYLLDTRNAAGVPMGVRRDAAGKSVPAAVNGYGAIADASTELERIGVTTSKRVSAAQRVQATSVSAVPTDAPQPVVKSVRVENGKVYVTVADTVPYLQYNVSQGATPDAVGKSAADVNVATPAQGAADREIVIEAPANGSSGFFRVNRN